MLKRALSSFSSQVTQQIFKEKLKIQSWQIHDYGGVENLQLGSTRVPVIKNPYGLLVEVKAASVNPIDLLMSEGYGRTLFQIPRQCEMELPLTLGRDFSGTIIGKGPAVKNFQIGDDVYGFIPLHKNGSFTEVVLTDTCNVLPKPKNLSHVHSTSLVYATMTAWSALFVFGNLLIKQTDGLRVLILGASGGVGTAALQLLKSQGCEVFCTCSEDATQLVSKLGADHVFNYRDKEFEKKVQMEGRYHIILDGAKIGYENIPSDWQYDTYITLNSPLLKNTDQYGLLYGLLQSGKTVIEANLSRFASRSSVRWGFFIPSFSGFKFIDNLIVNDKISPVIHKTFSFEQLPEALQTVANGHLRGKVVIDF